jgi:hypothetical protein
MEELYTSSVLPWLAVAGAFAVAHQDGLAEQRTEIGLGEVGRRILYVLHPDSGCGRSA